MQNAKTTFVMGIVTVIAMVVISAVVAIPAKASVVSFTYQAEFAGITGGSSDLDSLIGTAPIYGSFVFEAATPDDDLGDPTLGTYIDAVSHVMVNGQTFAGSFGTNGFIIVSNRPPPTQSTSGGDVYQVIGGFPESVTGVPGYNLSQFRLFICDVTGAMLESDALPVEPPDIPTPIDFFSSRVNLWFDRIGTPGQSIIVFYTLKSLTKEIHVPTNYSTIQAAIDAAVPGDTILVADGTYTGVGNKDMDFHGKAITVQSENGPDNCIIDCGYDGRGFLFHSGEGQGSVVSGFTITNGLADNGAGIVCWANSSPTITNCTIFNNLAWHGGGILCTEESSPTITNCTISSNMAALGGGIHCYRGASPAIMNSIISKNTANLGGGILCQDYAKPKFTNCTITGNKVSDYGGGLCCHGYPSWPTFTNCILWANTPDEIACGTATVTYCDVQGGYTGEGNIDAAPLLVGVSDYHLRSGSPCIDAGSNDALQLPANDFEGDLRILDGDNDSIARVDIGADEFNVCEGDFDGDGDVDGSDLAVFAADFGRTDCSDDCEGDFDNDGDVDGSDLAVFAADFGRTDCPISE